MFLNEYLFLGRNLTLETLVATDAHSGKKLLISLSVLLRLSLFTLSRLRKFLQTR